MQLMCRVLNKSYGQNPNSIHWNEREKFEKNVKGQLKTTYLNPNPLGELVNVKESDPVNERGNSTKKIQGAVDVAGPHELKKR